MWPIFHGPVTLSCISKTIWCMCVIVSDNETVWPKLWPQSKYKSTWPIFHGLMILLNIFKIIWSSHLISVPYPWRSSGHHRWRCNNTFPFFPVFRCPQGISKPHSCPFLDVIFPSLLLSSSPSCSFHCPLQNCLRHARGSWDVVIDYLMDEHYSWYNGSVWHIHWPYQVYVGQWPIFYGPAILLHILKTIWWRNVVFRIMDHCDSKIDLVKYMWVSDLYFMVHWFYLISLSDLNYFYTLRNGTGRGYSCPSVHLL